MVSKPLNPKNHFIATVLAYATVPLSGFATDVYLPSFPQMASQLQVAEHSIQITLSLYLVSYGLFQIISGILVDAYGRYRLCLSALLVFSASCLVITITDSIMVIYLMRIIQGICTAFTVVAARAFFLDVYEEGPKKKMYLSLMTIVWSAGPIIAPFVGGYLQHIFGWRSNFVFLAVYGFILFLFLWIFSGETIKHRIQANYRSILKSYKTILSARDFIFGIFIIGVSYAMIMFFSLSGPFIIEHDLGFSPVVMGYVALILGLAWMCGGFIGKQLINRDLVQKIKVAYAIQILLVVLMITTPYFIYNIYTIVLFAFLVHVTAGFIFNNYFTYCVGRFPQLAGIAGGITGGFAYSFTSVLSYAAIAVLKPHSQATIGIGYLIIGMLGVVALWFSRKLYTAK